MVVGTVSTFFDLSAGLGALILGGAAAVTNDQGGFLTGSLLALIGLGLLWGGIDPRARRAPVAVRAVNELSKQGVPDICFDGTVTSTSDDQGARGARRPI